MRSWIDSWAVRSQQGSRRNAMIALTALTQRRAEVIEVEEFLAARVPHPAPSRPGPDHGVLARPAGVAGGRP